MTTQAAPLRITDPARMLYAQLTGKPLTLAQVGQWIIAARVKEADHLAEQIATFAANRNPSDIAQLCEERAAKLRGVCDLWPQVLQLIEQEKARG